MPGWSAPFTSFKLNTYCVLSFWQTPSGLQIIATFWERLWLIQSCSPWPIQQLIAVSIQILIGWIEVICTKAVVEVLCKAINQLPSIVFWRKLRIRGIKAGVSTVGNKTTAFKAVFWLARQAKSWCTCHLPRQGDPGVKLKVCGEDNMPNNFNYSPSVVSSNSSLLNRLFVNMTSTPRRSYFSGNINKTRKEPRAIYPLFLPPCSVQEPKVCHQPFSVCSTLSVEHCHSKDGYELTFNAAKSLQCFDMHFILLCWEILCVF